jgi:nucleotide-binding universal stress UspA family protein
MKLLQNILVPVDFNPSSIHAIKYAASISGTFNSHLILLHVISAEKLSSQSEVMLKETVREKYDALRSEVGPDIAERMELVIERGVVFEQIIRTSIKRDVNVIIAGTGDHPEGRLSTMVEKLMRKNQVPLWLVKNHDMPPVKKILCPVDFSDASVRAMNNAILLATKLDAVLTVMHVYTEIDIQSPRLRVDNEEENRRLLENKKTEMAAFIKRFELSAVRHDILLEKGQPDVKILDTLRTQNTDLLIMGTTGKSSLSRILMGSVTEKVTREATCSFITTKSQDIAKNWFESNLGEMETYLQQARQYREVGDTDKAIDCYTSGLKQFPDNIPMLQGLIELHSETGNTARAAFFREYAREVVLRLWGRDYLEKFGL